MVESGLELEEKTFAKPVNGTHSSINTQFHSQRENGTTFSEVQFCPENFQWNEPKTHVKFTTQPKFPESLKLGKWKTPTV